MTTLVRDLLQLPTAVLKGDFVQGLAEGIANPEATLRDYAVPPLIAQSFQSALAIVRAALESGRSQAVYLDGSFGAGKSHFMAVMALLLADDSRAWAREELKGLRGPNPWVGAKKLAQLPIHMLGAQDIESKIFGTYVRWVAERHPEAPVPPLYVDEGLFEDARRLRERMGDEKFFADLNGGVAQTAARWGKRAATATWDAASFEAAASGRYVGDENSDARSPRARLFSDLVRAFFSSWTSQRSRFVELDAGLARMSNHAKTLGYDGVVLYLDELILWLAGRAADLAFVGQEAQKLVKLKEAQEAARGIPIVSFIARQRDLDEFIGAEAKGAVRAQISRNLAHHDGRFASVSLADRNLPAIVKHRVVRPRDAEAAERLKDDFAKTWRLTGQAASVLIGSEGDEAAFEQVYPFSPALVEALVVLSNCLQRERTAIRILMELLVLHVPDLQLGKVVPVGDVFDALAESEDPIDEPVMKARFERARDLYRTSFLPIIRRTHGTDSPAACQRLRDDHDARLGCSRCPKTLCRNDNRLAKTLLLAALAPTAKPFEAMTVKRLVHLNHGTLTSPLPGAELKVAASRLADWGGQISALRVGEQADPEVSIHLLGVDLQPILAAAAEADGAGARRNLMRRLLFKALDLPLVSSIVEDEQPFFGTKRAGRVRYGNVREMDDALLTAPDDKEWQVVLDYPFDERGQGPADDLARLDRYRESAVAAGQNPTVVWLPTFFASETEQELGKLVVIEHILEGDASRYLGHLRVEDQQTTLADLRSLRARKEMQLERAIAQAYGVAMATGSTALDPSRAVDEHVVWLLDDMSYQPTLAGTMKEGLRQLVDALLSKRYPHHPRFDGPISATRLERPRQLLERLLDQPTQRMGVERAERQDLKAYADPLGLTDTSDANTVLNERPLREIEQQRLQSGIAHPSVRVVRGWLDRAGTMGLVREVEDLLILTWGTWSGRSLELDARALPSPRLGQLPDEAVLVLVDLPTHAEWDAAYARAGELFGIALAGRSLVARNLAAFESALLEKAAQSPAPSLLPDALQQRLDAWEVADAPRLATARACATLCERLAASRGAALVRVLASLEAPTSIAAMGRSLASAPVVAQLLGERARWVMFDQVRRLEDDPTKRERARALLADLRAALADDEQTTMLSQRLGELGARAEELLRVPVVVRPPPGWSTVLDEVTSIGPENDPAALAERLRALVAQVASAAEGALEVRIDVAIKVARRDREP